MNLLLQSVCASDATTGKLTGPGIELYTMEPPWRGDVPDKSCVPAGTYQLLPYFSPKHGRTWRLHNPDLGVWGASNTPPRPMRTQVELHSGNWADQSEGCILLGLNDIPMRNPADGQVDPAVDSSVDAVEKLRAALDGSPVGHTLQVVRGGTYVAPAALDDRLPDIPLQASG